MLIVDSPWFHYRLRALFNVELVSSATCTAHVMLAFHLLYLFLIPLVEWVLRMNLQNLWILKWMETRELIHKGQVVQEKV